MFKTTQDSLEELSFAFDARTLANIHSVLTYLKQNDLSTLTPQQTEDALRGIEQIGQLQLEGKIYAFHVYDSFAEEQLSEPAGVELYLRQGDRLEEWLVPASRDFVYQEEKAATRLTEAGIQRVYTGDIPSDGAFLGLPHECDEDHPVTRSALDTYQIELFESKGIEVVTLDTLI